MKKGYNAIGGRRPEALVRTETSGPQAKLSLCIRQPWTGKAHPWPDASPAPDTTHSGKTHHSQCLLSPGSIFALLSRELSIILDKATP